ncbi:MAG: hypothetical protein NXH73_07010 [Flavobacteriaceae bacterium]|nr:hypothetical protein [Flavobacteriaceae bacterium]
MLKLYIIGLLILVTAILANVLASKLGLLSWYDFLNLLSDKGRDGFKEVGFFDYLWLLLLYPLALGLGYWFGIKIFQAIFG